MGYRKMLASLGLGAALLLGPVGEAAAQEIPQPLLGSCCACKGKIQFTKSMDLLQLGARILPQPGAIIDPITTGMTVTLENSDGTIFTQMIPPGVFTENVTGTRLTYKDNAAKQTGGIKLVHLKRKDDGFGDGFLLEIKAYGDFASATLAEMTTLVNIGTSSFFDNGDWVEKKRSWRRKFVTP